MIDLNLIKIGKFGFIPGSDVIAVGKYINFSIIFHKFTITMHITSQIIALQCINSYQLTPRRVFEPTIPCSKCGDADHRKGNLKLSLWKTSRVTRLGDFLPIGYVFTLGYFIYLSCRILGYFLTRLRFVCTNFDKKWVGLHFGRFFHKLIWSP
jgi:hypothetical protein